MLSSFFFFFIIVVVDVSSSLFVWTVAALMAMKNKMNDASNVLDGWDINSVDPCTWNMVGCTPEGFVISL